MLFEVFRAAFTATVETMFGLDMSRAGGCIDDEKVMSYYRESGGNPLAAALAMGAKHDLSRIDKLREKR